jgi:hypothetical protein
LICAVVTIVGHCQRLIGGLNVISMANSFFGYSSPTSKDEESVMPGSFLDTNQPFP